MLLVYHTITSRWLYLQPLWPHSLLLVYPFGSSTSTGITGSWLTKLLEILTNWSTKSSSLQHSIRHWFIAVPSPTVRMSFPPGWTWTRTNMEDHSQPNRWKMLKLSMGFFVSCSLWAHSLPVAASNNYAIWTFIPTIWPLGTHTILHYYNMLLRLEFCLICSW